MKITHILLALMLLVVTSGCGTASTPTSPTPGGTVSPKESMPVQAAANPDAVTEKTIKHAMGTATLKKTPVRVVYLYQSMNDIGAALGVKPVGAVQSTDQKPWFKYLGDMSGVTNLGDEGQPNVEAIVALKPDLIFATKVRHEKIYAQLEAIAPTLVTEDLADWKGNLQLAADALGKKDKAATFTDDFNKRVADFKNKMGSKLATTEVSLIRIQKDNSVKIYIEGFPGLFLRDIGFPVPKAQQVKYSGSGLDILSKEHIPQFDGDYIFDITTALPGQENVPKLHEEWSAHPLWKELKAVKNNKYFKVDPITWNFGAGPLAAKAMLDDMFKYFALQ
ncbi:putative siderophore-binding lipoprotein YfiY precursor [compost metagenome]